MRHNIKISLAQKHDAPAITQIGVASHRYAYKDIIPAAILDALDDSDTSGWESTIQKFPGNVLIARDDTGEITGFICAGPVVDKEKNAGFDGQVYGMHVKPGLNGKGIGSQLLKTSFDSLKQRGIKSVIVWTFRDNEPAIDFYAKHGAVFIRESPVDYHGLPMTEAAYGWRDIPS